MSLDWHNQLTAVAVTLTTGKNNPSQIYLVLNVVVLDPDGEQINTGGPVIDVLPLDEHHWDFEQQVVKADHPKHKEINDLITESLDTIKGFVLWGPPKTRQNLIDAYRVQINAYRADLGYAKEKNMRSASEQNGIVSRQEFIERVKQQRPDISALALRIMLRSYDRGSF